MIHNLLCIVIPLSIFEPFRYPLDPTSDRALPHSFRAIGPTRFLEEGGTLEGAQNINAHEW